MVDREARARWFQSVEVKAWEDVGETVPLPDDDVPVSGTRAQGPRGGPSLVQRAGWLHQRSWFRLGESLVVLRRRGDPSDGVSLEIDVQADW